MSATYEHDLYTWTQAQAQALREKKWAALDVGNLAEEIESLGNEQAHAVESHLANLLLHLLKWHYQPRRRSRSWRTSLYTARSEIRRRLRRSPSLRPEVPMLVETAYVDARKLAMHETGLPLSTFPERCPWSLDQLQDEDFLSEEMG